MPKRQTILASICGLLCFVFLSSNSHAQVKQAAVDTLVICSSDLQTALGPWVDYRRKQGHKSRSGFRSRPLNKI